MALPSQETITILALDRHQQTVFRVRSISGGLNQNFLDDAVAFGQNSPTDTLSSEKPLFIIKRDAPSHTGQQPSGPPPRWVRALVGLILGSSFPS